MQMTLVPGYRSLFGEPTITYEQLLSTIPSVMVISIAIALNNELNAPIEINENQRRIRQIVSFRFSPEQLGRINSAYHQFTILSNNTYDGYVFGRRYLLAMVLKELSRNSDVALTDTSGDQEFNFLLAYLLIIDEVNNRDSDLLAQVVKSDKDSLFDYKLIWTSYISQFQLNEKANVPFETFKLLCFLKHALKQYRPFLKEYLKLFSFDSIGKFIYSFFQVAQAGFQYNSNAAMSKLNFIKPAVNIDTSHLDSLTLNCLFGKVVDLSEIKKFPLFMSEGRGYMIIDHDFYLKKLYKGPFFDLYKTTSLKKNKDFNAYSSEVSKNVLEETCFNLIMSSLKKKNDHDVLCFDDGSESCPDCYFRSNRSIMLMEFKGYLFPDELPSKPDFETMKKYIDARFIMNEKGKSKGIGQLVVQIENLLTNKQLYDLKIKDKINEKEINIFPVIVVDDFNFTLPSLNEYLNTHFRKQLEQNKIKTKIRIQDLTIINLDLLYEMGAYGNSFDQLIDQVCRYHKILVNRKEKLRKTTQLDINLFLNTKASFDEIYHTIFVKDKEIVKHRKGAEITRYTDKLRLTQQDLDCIL